MSRQQEDCSSFRVIDLADFLECGDTVLAHGTAFLVQHAFILYHCESQSFSKLPRWLSRMIFVMDGCSRNVSGLNCHRRAERMKH
jgi:hypothetical protein